MYLLIKQQNDSVGGTTKMTSITTAGNINTISDKQTELDEVIAFTTFAPQISHYQIFKLS